SLVLRLEDIDPDRSRPAFAEALMDDLHWLGLDWDEGPYWQSQRLALYEQALLQLTGHTYPCYCTRKELRTLAGAPHVGDTGVAYPGTCSNLSIQERRTLEAQGRRACLRLRCPEQPFTFEDVLCGLQSTTLEACGGDFALRRSDGVLAYQLAVVVDDGLMGITQVVRGDDLLLATPRQLALFDLLGFPRPEFAHVPLLCDASGERLAKRHQSLTLRCLRDAGISAQAICGYLGYKAGLLERPMPYTPKALLPLFSPAPLALRAGVPVCIEQDLFKRLACLL
ncbi:MAG: tRNA glutamyl-Q(34) synthetase GluQRS, partial [Bilophila sp.]